MSRDTVVCTTSCPALRSASASSVCVDDRLLADEPQDRGVTLVRGSCVQHLREDLERAVDVGVARRRAAARGAGRSGRTSGRRGRRRAPRRRPAAPGRRARRRRAGRRRAPRRRRAAPRGRRSRRSPFARTLREQLVVDRVAHGDGGGADDGVAAERRAVVAGLERAGRVVGDEQAADRQAVRERLGERDELRPHAELLEREEACRSGRRRSAPRRTRAARRARRRARPRRRGTPARAGSRRPRRAPARAARARRRRHAAACSDVDVVRRREARAGQQRLERRALRRLARDGERADRPAVEALLERDHARLAGRLARVLQRGLVRLGAGVAEERLRAAEAIRQPPRELGAPARVP